MVDMIESNGISEAGKERFRTAFANESRLNGYDFSFIERAKNPSLLVTLPGAMIRMPDPVREIIETMLTDNGLKDLQIRVDNTAAVNVVDKRQMEEDRVAGRPGGKLPPR